MIAVPLILRCRSPRITLHRNPSPNLPVHSSWLSRTDASNPARVTPPRSPTYSKTKYNSKQ